MSYAELDAASDRLAEFSEKVPPTASGKILRRELAEKHKAATVAR